MMRQMPPAIRDDSERLNNLFDRIAIEMASLPYYPEMLDFDLHENDAAEQREIVEYLTAFKLEPR